MAEKIDNTLQKHRQHVVKNNGWGYADFFMYYDHVKKLLLLHGKRCVEPKN
jgi:hypothetical protein